MSNVLLLFKVERQMFVKRTLNKQCVFLCILCMEKGRKNEFHAELAEVFAEAGEGDVKIA